MTDQTPLVGFRAALRIHVFYTPDPRFNVEPTAALTLSAENVIFGLPPVKGDPFMPFQLSKALSAADYKPVVHTVEHAPTLPFGDDADQDGYSTVIVHCSAAGVPSDELVDELRAEGWRVMDHRLNRGFARG